MIGSIQQCLIVLQERLTNAKAVFSMEKKSVGGIMESKLN